MSFPDEKKLGVQLHTRPFRDTISTIPIKKRRIFFSRSPSPPPEACPSTTLDYDTTPNKSSCLVQIPSSEAGDLPTSSIALPDKCSSLESGFNNLADRNISEPSKHQDLLTGLVCNDSQQVEVQLKDTFSDGKLVSLNGIDPPLGSAGFNNLADRNISEPSKHQELLTGLDCNDREQVEVRLKDTFSDGKLVFLNGIDPPLGSAGLVGLSMTEENLDAKNISNETFATEMLSGNTELHSEETCEKLRISESCSLKQEQLDQLDLSFRNKDNLDEYDSQKKSLLSEPNTASAQISLHRSIWDLNMTMDAWEEPLTDSAIKNHECDGNGGPDLGGLLGRVPQTHLIVAGETSEIPNALLSMFGESKSLSNDPFPSLHTSPKSRPELYNSETDPYLDLRLKPSFMPVSFSTCGDPFKLGKVDSLQEINFFSLSTKLTSTPKPNFFVCGAMKPEPRGCNPLVERKTKMYRPETLVLKPIKSESCEIREASRMTILGVPNSASDAAIKLEPVEDEDQSQDCVSAKETRVPHISAYDHNLLQCAKIPLEAVDTQIMASKTQSDSFIQDVILQTPREYPGPPKCEVNNMAQVMQDAKVFKDHKRCHSAMSAAASIPQTEIGFAMESLVDEGREFISIKHESNEGSEHVGFFIKCRSEESQNTNLANKLCEQNDLAADLLQESSTFEKVSDEKAEVVSCASLSEIDSKTEPGKGTYLNCDVLEVNKGNNELICMLEEEQCDNECKPCSSHVIDGMMSAVFERGGVDDHGYEDGELRDGGSLGSNMGSHFSVEIEKAENVCPIGPVDVPKTMPSSHEHVKHMTIESPEMSKDPGTVECVNNVDPAIAADLQESSSVTGDSSGRKTSKTSRKVPRESLRKDKVFERKTKFDRDPTIVNIDNNGEGRGVVKDAEVCTKSSFPLSSEAKRDAFDRGYSGRIINLKTTSSRNMNCIPEGPLSSRVDKEKAAYKSFKMEKCHSGRSRVENFSERSHETENEKQRGWACGKHGSGSMHMRVRGGSDSPHSRVRDKQRQNQFGDRNFDLNYMRDQNQGHDNFRYSSSIPSAEVSMNSISDARALCPAGRISRKATNELQSRAHLLSRRPSPPERMSVVHHPASEVSSSRCMQRDAPDLVYISSEKNCRTMAGEMLDRSHPHIQFDQADHIPVHRERMSLSPVRRRVPPQLSPAICSPRSQAMSPSHWSPNTTSECFNEQAEMLQCRSGATILMQESMRSKRQRFADEILEKRRRSGYGVRLSDGMMEVAPSREHEFPRSGRDYPRKIQPRRIPGEYCGSSFARGQIHEHAADSEFSVRRRYNEAHESVHYRQQCISGEEDEFFSFHDEGPPRSYRYHAEGNQGFNEGGNSRGVDGRFKNRLGNTSRRYRQIEEQHQREDDFSHETEQGWNDSGFNNARTRSRRY